MVRVWSSAVLVVSLLAFGGSTGLYAEDEEEIIPPEQGCSFRSDPVQFLNAQRRNRDSVHRRVKEFVGARYASTEAVSDAPAVRRNFIDNEIFGKLEQANVASARMSSDEEFFRRAYLDMIGRIPSAQAVKDFVLNAASDKRDRLIEQLIAAPEFNDKWAVWFEDLVGMTENPSTGNRRPRIEGRNSFDSWIREQMRNNRPMTEIVTSTLTGAGNNFFTENGAANFMVLSSVSMGPIQDTYDMMLSKSVTSFLGLGHYDCLLCHSGRGKMDTYKLSLWGSRTTRADAERMAAHFARVQLVNVVPGAQQYQNVLFDSTEVRDVATGGYDLNTTSGNRPNRTPFGTERSLTPEYRDGAKAGGNWRVAFASKLVADPLFAVNFVNRVWKEFFSMGLVDPVDTLDPDRLDPQASLPDGWTLQPTHPELLQALATFFRNNDTNLRELIKAIVQSSAYQLSSRYEGEWKVEYVPLFARHYPRRLMAEEIHDALVQATGVMPQYSWQLVNGNTVPQGTAPASLPKSDPVPWAMKMPDTTEPRFISGAANGSATNFMNSFNRGNRDTVRRNQSGSILQNLNLMNDNTIVLSKVKVTASPTLKELAKLTNNDELVDQIWLTFLSRKPSESERAKAVAYLDKANSAARNTAIEDLAWVAVNKVDFVFSY